MDLTANYRLLLCCNVYDKHITRFICNLKIVNPNCSIDVFSQKNGNEVPSELEGLVDNYFFRKTSNFKIGFLNKYLDLLSFIFSTRKISKRGYDVINIHSPGFEYAFVIRALKRNCKATLITPWGSDVYRSGGYKRKLLGYLFRSSSYCTCANNRFGNDVKTIFKLDDTRTVDLDIGSDTIDYIVDHKSIISPIDAKVRLGIPAEDFVITCGYNAAKAQCHQDIINAIKKVAPQIPRNLSLLFPMTYPKDDIYRNAIREKLEDLGINFILFDSYLPIDTVFLIRQATDMFIHIQTTDANSASVQEFLLCNKRVINGEWLRYKELESYNNIPYYILPCKENLPDAILNAFKDDKFTVSESVIKYIESYGWRKWIVKWNAFFCKFA